MGCSRSYWLGSMEKIYKVAGGDSFTWSKVMATYPDITKSVLSRLKCSGWICKDKRPIMVNGKPKISKTVLWKLHPEAIALCKNGGNIKTTIVKKPIKKCICSDKSNK